MSTLTKEEIFQLFGESERQIQEVWRLFKESDRKFQESIEEAKRERAEEAKRREVEERRRREEFDRQIKEVNKSIGHLSNRLGRYVEEMVKPAVVRLFRERGIEVHHVYPRATARYEDDAMEIDLLVVNTTEAVLVEVKSELKLDDVKEHLDRLARFKKLFPDHRERRVMGAVAAMVVPDETARFAYRQGLFVLGQSGETMTLRNDAKFEPKIW